MRRTVQQTVQQQVAVFLSLLALLPLVQPALAQGTPAVQLNESVSTRGGTVTGTVWRGNDSPVSNASLQLRDVASGEVVRTTRGDELGRFTFLKVSPGSYVVELVDEKRNVLALGEMFSIGPTETVATIVRLGTATAWYGGFFGNAAAAAIAAAVTVGVTALGNGGQPASARF
jgi:hypothetical protein